jgi:putative ABC transport system substrate-binding protein
MVSLITLLVFGVAMPLAADQPQLQTMPRIGFLASGSSSSTAAWIDGFRRGLWELGYVEGRSIVIEWRYGEGKTERFPALVTELTQRNVAVIVVGGATATRAAKQNGTPIPVVMVNVTDPVELGLVTSLARPGANITGVSNLAPELGRKRLELLKEVIPRLARVAVLGDPSSPSHSPGWRETKTAAKSLGIQVHSVEVREPNPDFPGAFAAITRHRPDALITLSQPLILVHRRQIVDFTSTHRMPAIFHTQDFVEAGGLMSYGANVPELYRRAAIFVDKILKGARPADLPVEQPVKFDLVVNVRTAKSLGLSIPQSLLVRADRIIE